MREIKFRAWDKKRELMVGTDYPEDWSQDRDDYDDKWEPPERRGINGIEELSENDRFILMQFTGLKDKNGKEIYEGDVILGGYRIDRPPDPYIVSWNNEYAGFDPLVLYNDDTLDFFMTDRCEVIGNVYENPKLLEFGPSHDEIE